MAMENREWWVVSEEWRVENRASRAGQRDVLNVKCEMRNEKCSQANARCKCEVASKLRTKQIPRRVADATLLWHM